MSDPVRLMIQLPDDSAPEVRHELVSELKAMDGVNDAGDLTARNVGPQEIRMWVELIGTVVTTAGAAVPVFQKLLDVLRRKEIRGVKVKLANGTVLDVDHIDAEQLKELVGKTG